MLFCSTMAKLTNRRWEIFATELATGAPLLSAYLAAGYRDTWSARYNASRLRNKPAVRARVDELLAEFGERNMIKSEYLMHQILPIVEADTRNLFEVKAEADGRKTYRLRSLADLPHRLAAAVQKIKLDEAGNVTEITLHNKNETANTLLRALGTIKDDHVTAVLAILGKRLDELDVEELRAFKSHMAVLDVSSQNSIEDRN
jgi:Terminase small subunit